MSARAATVTWTGASTTTNQWSDPTNWLNNTPPSANGDTIVFDSNSTGRLGATVFDLTFTQLTVLVNPTFSGTVVNIGPFSTVQTLDLATLTISSTATAVLIISNPMSVNTQQTWTISGNNNSALITSGGGPNSGSIALGATLTLSGSATGAGSGFAFNAGGITGGGGLTLSATNTSTVSFGGNPASYTYSGATTINSGTLSFSDVAELNSSNSITISGQNATTNLAQLSFTGSSETLVPGIVLGTVASANVLNVPTAATILSLTGSITGGNATGTSVSLLINGSGVVSLENPTHSNNTFTGGVTVDTGAGLRFSGDNGATGDPQLLGNTNAKTITIQNGARLITLGTTTIDMTSTGTKLFSIGTGGGTIDITSGANFIFNVASTMAGTGLLTIQGAGGANFVQFGNTTVIAVNSHSGGMTVDNATINVFGQGNSDPTFLGSGVQTITLQNGGRFLVNSVVTGQTGEDFSAGTKSIAMGTGGGIIEAASGFSILLNDAGQVAAGNGGSATIRGAGTVFWGSTTAATVAINHLGPVIIDGGTLNVVATGTGDQTNLGPGTKTVTIQNGGKLQINTSTGSSLFAPTAGTKSFVIGTGGGTIDVGSGFSVLLNFAGQLSGTGALTKSSPGLLDLASQTVGFGGAAGYTGGQFNLTGGTLTLRNPLGLGGGAGGTQAAISMSTGTAMNLYNDGSTVFGHNVTITGTVTINVDRNATTTNGVLTLGSLTTTGTTSAITVSNGDGFGLAISGTTSLTGTVNLANTAALNQNTLTLAAATALTWTNTGATPLGALNFGAGSSLTIGNVNATPTPLTVSGATTLAGAATLTSSIPVFLSGDLTGSFTLTKTGAGLFVYDGTQTGATALNITGGTFSGNGTLLGAVTTSGTVTVAPGDVVSNVNQVGTLGIGGGITTASGTVFNYQLGSPNDTIACGSGAVSVTGLLNATAAPGYMTGTTYHLIQTTGTITNNLTLSISPANTLASLVITPGVPNSLDYIAGAPTVFTWNGSAGDTEWTTGGNWVGGSAPPSGSAANGAALVFPAGAPLTMHNGYATDTSFNSITFADNYVVTGNRLLLYPAAGNSIAATAGSPVVNLDLSVGQYGATITLSGSGTLTIGSSNGTNLIDNSTTGFALTLAGAANSVCTINSIVSGTGNLNVTGGTLALQSANTLTGITTISTGGTLSANTLLNGGTRGSLGAGTNAAANLVLNGGTLLYTGGTASTDRSFTLTAPSTLSVQNAATTLTLTGTNGGASPVLTKAGPGTLALGGATDNTLLSVTASAGTLNLAKTSSGSVHAIGGVLTINAGATVQLTGSGNDQINTLANVVITSGGTLDMRGLSEGFNQLNGTGTVTNSAGTPCTLSFGESGGFDTFAGVIKNTGGALSIQKSGTGIETLTGANTFTGTTTVNSGTLALSGASNRLPTATTVIFSGTSTLDLGNNPQTIAGLTINDVSNLTATLANSTTVSMLTTPLITLAGTASSSTTGTGNPGTLTGGVINIGGGVIDGSAFGISSGTSWSTTKVINSTLAGSGGLTIKSYGDTSDSGGGGPQRFVLSGANTFTGGITMAQGFLMWTQDSAFGDPSNTITLQANAGLLTTVSTTLAANRTLTLFGVGDRYFREYGGIPLVCQANVIGSGNIRTIDGGLVTFSGTNTNTGGMIVGNTTQIIAGANNAFSSVSPVNVVSSGTFSTGGFSVAAGSLTSAVTTSIVAIGTGSLTIGGDNTSPTYAGAITGSGTFTKTGSGTQILTGTAIAYTGAVNVNAGFLEIDGTETAASPTTVNAGGTLSGKGTILGNVTLAAGGSIDPGTLTATTTLNLTSSGTALTMVPGSYLNMLVASAPETATTVTTGNTFLNVPNGTVALGGGTLNVIGTGVSPFVAGTYRIANIKSVTGTLVPGIAPPGFAITSIAITTGVGAGAAIDVTFGAAQTYTWSGNGADSNWMTAANWNSGAGPAPSGNAGETLIFPAGAVAFSANNNFPAGTAFASIQFGASYAITGNSTLLGVSPAVITSTAGTTSINMNMVFASGTVSVSAGSTLTIGTLGTNLLNNGGAAITLSNAGTLVINSLISGGGGLTQSTSAGTTTLNGANTYGGTTTISTGSVVLGNAAALGTSLVGTTVASGAMLDLNGQTINEILTLTGTGIGGVGALINSSTSPASDSGQVNAGTCTVGGTGNITLSGQVMTGPLTKIGTNTLTLSGSGDNSSLAVVASGGTVIFAKNSTSGVHAVGNGTAQLTINTGALVQMAGTGTFQFAVSQPVIINGGTLDLNGNNEGFGTLSGTGGTITDNSATAGTTTLTISAGSSGASYSGLIADGAARTLALIVAGTASTNELTLNNANNTFSGGITVNSGRIQVPVSSVGSPGAITSGPFGKGTVTVNSTAPTTSTGGEVFFNTIGVTIANNFVVAGRSGEGFGALRFDPTGTFTVSGNVTMTADTRIGQANAGNPVATFNGTISGNQNIEFYRNTNGTPVFALGSTAVASWTGNTTLTFATLKMGAANQMPNGAGFGDLIDNGVFDVGGFSETLNGLSGAGAIDSSVSGTPTLSFGGNNATGQTFTGVARNTAGSLALSKIGGGLLTVAGFNSFTGGLNVLSGTLSTTGSASATGSGTVTLNGGTLSLGSPQVQLSLTGFNQDTVRAAVDPNTTPFGTTGDVDGVSYIFNEIGATGAPAGAGLPSNLTVTNSLNGILYKLQPYSGGGNNDLVIQGTTTGTLTVGNGALLTSLHILDMGGSGASTYTTTLNFSDTSSTLVSGGSAADWFNGTNADGSAAVLQVGTRALRTTGAYDGITTNPRLYEYNFNLAAGDQLKTVTSIKFSNAAGTGEYLNVFAITATVSTQTYPNNLVVNSNSTLDMQSGTTAVFGTLTIGNNTLSVTGVTGASVIVSNTTLAGNSTFNPAPNTTLTLGNFNDGGTPYALTKVGLGTLAVNTAATSLVSGTTMNVSAGTLNMSGAGALGTVASVTLGSNSTLALNANQTLGALNGANSAAITLNGKTLTLGSTNNLNSTVASPISDGTGAAGTGGLATGGTGTAILTGTNTFTGATTVPTGTLRVDGSLTATSGVSLSNGAFLRGIGTIGGTGTVTSSGIIFPGDTPNPADAKGTLTLPNVTINANGIVKLRVSGGPGSLTADNLVLTGSSVVLTNTSSTVGATLELHNALAQGNYGTSTTLISMTNGTPLAATFTNVNVPNQAVGNNQGVSIAYGGGNTQTIPANGQFSGGGGSIAGVGTVTLVLSTSVTPAKVESFTARGAGAGVRLAWNVVSEFQNVGFNLYRRAAGGGEWRKVNTALIAGRVTSPDAKTYRFLDWTRPGVYDYKLESVSVQGVTEIFPALAASVTIDPLVFTPLSDDSADTASESAAAMANADRTAETAALFDALTDSADSHRAPGDPVVAGAPIAALARNADGSLPLEGVATVLPIHPRDAETRDASAPAPSAPISVSYTAASARWFSSATLSPSNSAAAAKIVYADSGVLLVPQSSLPAGYDVHHLSITRAGVSVTPLAVTPAGLLLYGAGYQDDYTNKDVFFARFTAASTVAGQSAAASGLFQSSLPVNVNSPANATVAFHDVYFDYNGIFRPYVYQPWFSSEYLTQGSTQSFSVSTPDATGGVATLTVTAWSLTSSETSGPDHALQVLVNSQPAGQIEWNGGNQMMQLSFNIPAGLLNNGANQIDLATPQLDGVTSQIAFVYSLSINYTRSLNAAGPVTVANSTGATQLFELASLPSANAWVVDLRYPDRAALVAAETQAQQDGTFKLRFLAPAGGAGQFLVVPAGMENAPLAVTARIVKPLRSPLAYLAVGPSQFSAGAQALALAHSKEGLKSIVADQEQLFDYYNYGRYGPVGIQNAVRSLRPQYVLLLGRTTYDYLNYSGANVDPMCPAFLVPTTFWAQTTSDSMFGDRGRGYPEVAVGRLPVNNAAELNVAVHRILAYQGPQNSAVRLSATADAPDPVAGDFAGEMEGIRAANPELTWQPDYYGTTFATPQEVTSAMTDAANGAADWLLYAGHGNAVSLGTASPALLDTQSVQNWTGNVVFLQSTCTGNWMAKDVPDYHSIAIQALTQPQGGISASIGTSTYMESECATQFMSQLLMQANGSGVRWGDALMKAQQWAFGQDAVSYYGDLNKTEQLFGDPAMKVFSATSRTGSGASGSAPSGGTSAGAPSAGTF